MVLDGGTERFIGKGLKSAQNRMVYPAAKSRHLFTADTKSHKGRFIEIERKLRLGSRRWDIFKPGEHFFIFTARHRQLRQRFLSER